MRAVRMAGPNPRSHAIDSRNRISVKSGGVFASPPSAGSRSFGPSSLDRWMGSPEVRNILTGRSVMITSRLTSRARTTIPQPIRSALRLNEGDEITYEIADDHVILRKAKPAPADDPFRTFEEWESEADKRAYAGL
jgi:antitoxin PrlF